MSLQTSEKFLHEIVSTVSSSLELKEVLRSVVRLMSEASGVHACFAYLVEEDGTRLVLRAASSPYERQVGKVAFERGESLAWWAAEHGEPAFIRDNALADPRTKYVPELEEERFQSLLAVPIVDRAGEAIGVITAHTEAPREFSDDEVDFLVTSSSLVAGAIENAHLYEETRRRVSELEQLTELGEAIARAEVLGDLLEAVVADARPLLAARACHVYLLDPAREELYRKASDPEGGNARQTLGLAELGPELARGGRSTRLAIPLVVNDELIGLLVAEGSARVELGRAVASQVAVAVKKIQVIEQLAEKNLIKDFFEELAGGRPRGDLEGRAARLGCDLDQRHVVLVVEPSSEPLERALRNAAPGSLFDRRDDSLRALVKLASASGDAFLERIRRAHAEIEPPVSVGVSSVCQGEAAFADGFAEAQQALLGTVVLKGKPAVLSYEELGAYKYLLRIAVDGGVRDATVDAVSNLAEYDAQRGAQLVATLEEFLRRHGSISATSEALYVHPNTLRQRLRRIGELSGLDLRKDDWLLIEIAVKMVKLQQTLGAAKTHT
ncbi:MAG: GAF domain-containing protein [Thermoleophilia bacterium]|nr:GAF domain-containing protein [Thermoleophilia bacterium]MDH4339467.1 GAF domain-containing protein [Thermoleophilia bacterium]MDH5280864.1 GAF domain-containing protein [Thermoleophilia bacterium]